MTLNKEIIDRLERKVLLRILIYVVAAVCGYMVMDLFLEVHEYSVISSVISISVFSVLAWCTYKNYKLKVAKHTTSVLLIVSVFGSFISFNGFKGVFLLDYTNLIFFLYFMFTGRERFLYAVGLVLVLLFAFYMNAYQPQHIHYLYEGKYEDHYFIFGIVSRSINAVILAISIKVVYEQERRNAHASNEELQAHLYKLNELYSRLESQAIEFREQNEYIQELNTRLEERVLERTERLKEKNKKIIEYAFFNAHKIRGPLARILGLVELTNIEKDVKKETLVEYLQLIKKSAVELDNMVESINAMLEQTKEEG